MDNYDFTYTGAEIQAILDTAKKLKDSGYIFLGVATPSTNPGTPTQKVYYEAKQAGTYTNFGGVVLPDGISLLIWNGSWTSETVMCGDGGVFDISVYKSSGGTLATFADLAAALDGGNNIPASARKGGMSVKFVQSSDNKYVQFRYMSSSTAAADFTNVANWQGVDGEPTVGSKNLVESGGVFPFTTLKFNGTKSSTDYSSLNDVEVGTITRFSSLLGISNIPTTTGGTLICGKGYSESGLSGVFQLFISNHLDDNGNGRLYFRSYWGDVNDWSTWEKVSNYDDLPLHYNGRKDSTQISDFDNAPLGTITTFVGLTGISHAPSTLNAVGGTLICTHSASTIGGGAIQIFISNHNDSDGSRLYYRSYWGDGSGWSSWKKVITSDDFASVALLFNGRRTSSEISDLNNAPIGTVTSFVSLDGISNAPNTLNKVGGTLICTHSAKTLGGGAMQIFISQHNDYGGSRMYYRSWWGDDSTWSNWKRVATKNDIDDAVALKYNGRKSSSDYSDFNDVPIGTITTFAGLDGILNAPQTYGNVGGTLICCHSTSSLSGGVTQIFISQYNDSCIYYRTYWSDGSGWSTWSSTSPSITSCLSSFLRIGVIGDSYASGLVMDGNDVQAGTEYWSVSWIQQLARINGVTGINYSKSGATCASWLGIDNWERDKAYCIDKLQNDDPCDLYYMAMGRNDRNGTDSEPIGTIADINDENPSQNAYSFYGNYGRIVEIVKAKSPNAKIIFMTMDANTADGNFAAYNEAITAIANHYGVPVINQYNEPFFNSDYYKGRKIGNHPTVQLYGGMAKTIQEMTLKCMVLNYNYFNTIIPTSIQ